jgi:hypothetical protein
MKAIIEIELEIDGEWRESDKDKLADMIMTCPHHGGWMVDEDRLNVFSNSVSIEIME